jgi:hypothetical protein
MSAANGFRNHWNWPRLNEMESCDTLVLLRGEGKEIPPELVVVAGFAAVRNLNVIWIGPPIEPLDHCRNIHFFANLDEFRKKK